MVFLDRCSWHNILISIQPTVQMPSLKMKTTTGCLKEKVSLHVCRKSSVISKSPLSRARIPQDAEALICTQSNQDGKWPFQIYILGMFTTWRKRYTLRPPAVAYSFALLCFDEYESLLKGSYPYRISNI